MPLHLPKLLKPAMSVYSATHGAHVSAAASISSNGLVATLSKWSVSHGKKELPLIPDVKTIHVYDFDNTLFLSPLPNPKLWSGPTLGQLQHPDIFFNGGWWHDSTILAATGEGIEKEEQRAWEGWWNEHIVSLVELSMAQKDTLRILLTGRSVKGFSELIQRMVDAKKLEFDIICLKPEEGPEGEKIANTKDFKTTFLTKVMDTYVHTEDIKVYEDRIGHVHAFERFFSEYNATITKTGRKPLIADVVQVAALTHTLDPVIEAAEIQRLINDHNAQCQREGKLSSQLQIKKQVFFTGYLISPKATTRLLELFPVPSDDDIRILASNIMITPRRANEKILDRAGGLGHQVEFEVIGIGCWQDKIWAALVRPVDPKMRIYTDNPKPIIVLAHRRGAKPIDANMIKKWQEVDEGSRFRFTTTVGEKMLLRIEPAEESNNKFERDHHNHHYHLHQQHQYSHYHHHPYAYGGQNAQSNSHEPHHNGAPQGGLGNGGRGGRRRNFGYDDRRPTGPRIRRT
ncbi:hypothetical protein BDZ91DRAFT_388243 [Kalaharituber pfeilii]|nr:hypothetical protein BDZ91DRAFT_388243 [Kalaharituber pfeilii]